MDTMSLSDPFLVLFKKQGNMWTRIGQTEVIHDNLAPAWVTKLSTDYHFEQQEFFKIEVYDIDSEDNINDLAAQDFLGSLQFQLHEVVTCIDQTMTKNLVNPKSNVKATVTIIAEEVSATANSEIVMFTPMA